MGDKERYIALALELAEKGRGRTSPNPMVGAVVVKDGRIIGRGFHAKAGGPHAEVVALQEAGDEARGATVYVSLEPCSHYGRTPPCVDRIIEAGISKVVVAMLDPNPLVAGRGIEKLRAAGIETEVGVLEKRAKRLNEVFIKYITTELPFVLIKMAMTLDGKSATITGDSRWISGEGSRAYVHHLRDEFDAVMVGIGTVLKDDPRLTARLPEGGGKDPIRIIVDSRGRIPLTAKVLNLDSPAKTMIAVTKKAPQDKVEQLRGKGIEVLVLPAVRDDKVDLRELLRELGKREIASVLVEGGGNLNWSLLDAGLVDKIVFFIAPKIVGGDKAPTPVEGMGIRRMTEALLLDEVEVTICGEDIEIIGYIRSR